MCGIGRRARLNHEGYLDLTAFLAIANLYEGDCIMTGWNHGDIMKVRLVDGRDAYRVVIRVHDRYATTLNLYDSESFENEYPVKADGKTYHADLGKVAFTKVYDMDDGHFVRAMGEEEFDKLLRKLGEVLGIPSYAGKDEGARQECERLKKELDGLSKECQEANRLRAEEEEKRKGAEAALLAAKQENIGLSEKLKGAGDVDALRKALDDAKEEIAKMEQKVHAAIDRGAEAQAAAIRAQAERDVYKDLYQQVLVKHDL